MQIIVGKDFFQGSPPNKKVAPIKFLYPPLLSENSYEICIWFTRAENIFSLEASRFILKITGVHTRNK